LRNGLFPTRFPSICLTTEESLALRIGRRRDPKPVLITVFAGRAHAEGVVFSRIGENIYLVASMPPKHLEGPPLPKTKPLPKKVPEKPVYQPSGSFEIDIQSVPKRLHF
jgi:putative RNA 2'-phosphotransferase